VVTVIEPEPNTDGTAATANRAPSLLPGRGKAPITSVPLYPGRLPPVDPTGEPWPGEELESGGVRLHVRRTPGPVGSTELAVFVHGLAGSATNWTDLAGLLAVRMPGLALDLPGFGRSAPPHEGYDFTLAAHAETVVRFVEGLGQGPVHLIGNSFGGTIALSVAAARPDLVRTLTLVSPAVPDLRPNPRRTSDPLVPLTYLPGPVGRRCRELLAAMTPRERVEKMLRLCFANPDDVPEQRLAQAIGEYAECRRFPWSAEALGRTTLGLIRAWLVPRSRSLWRLLPRVQAPALVVWGVRDRLVSPRKAPRTARLLPRGRLLMLPNTGHVAQMERPSTVARAVLGMLEAVDRGEW